MIAEESAWFELSSKGNGLASVTEPQFPRCCLAGPRSMFASPGKRPNPELSLLLLQQNPLDQSILQSPMWWLQLSTKEWIRSSAVLQVGSRNWHRAHSIHRKRKSKAAGFQSLHLWKDSCIPVSHLPRDHWSLPVSGLCQSSCQNRIPRSILRWIPMMIPRLALLFPEELDWDPSTVFRLHRT